MMRFPMGPAVALLIALAPVAGPAAGERAAEYDRVSLSASASAQVENDTLVAVLYEQREGDDPAMLAGHVNRSIGRAVARVKQVEDVEVQTLEYQTTPVYRDQHLSGWRVRQAIRLESRAADRLSELVGELQADLQVQSVSYRVSDEQRREAEERLMRGAIQGFTRRAALVAAELGRPDYRLVSMEIDTGGQPVRPMEMRMLSARAAPEVPPTLEAGTQTLEVTVRGTVELEPSQ
ncbi:MAG: SIMPL domain-containing protein [Chromatiales bacterium]|jgi:predicted secreted protein